MVPSYKARDKVTSRQSTLGPRRAFSKTSPSDLGRPKQ